jgi:hypothetical protein
MRVTQISTEEFLQIWQVHFVKLNSSQRKSFKLNAATKEICKFDRKAILRAITIGGRKYLKDILEYLEAQDRTNQKLMRPVRKKGLGVKSGSVSTPVLISGSCGHRYRCTCLDAFSVLRLMKVAA